MFLPIPFESNLFPQNLNAMKTYPTFQKALDTIKSLIIDQQTILIENIQNRLRKQPR